MRPFVLLLVLSGCGGKIVVDAAPVGDVPSTMDTPRKPDDREHQPPPFVAPAPAPATPSPLDACTTLCARDARCDTTIPALPVRDGEDGDCETRCQTRLGEKCGIDDWLLCYAARVDPNACTPLPEECRPAFCAWAKCARQPVSQCQ